MLSAFAQTYEAHRKRERKMENAGGIGKNTSERRTDKQPPGK